MPKPLAAIAAAALALAVPALASLPVGFKAPEIATQASYDGRARPFSLHGALRRGPVVLYFFPAAFTTGCTLEAHAFAEATDEFHRLGATVIGMSADPIDVLNRFSVQECRSKFPVASASPATINAYDVALPVHPNRSSRTSFVIAPDGKILYAYSSMNWNGHVRQTLDVVKAWHAKHPNGRA